MRVHNECLQLTKPLVTRRAGARFAPADFADEAGVGLAGIEVVVMSRFGSMIAGFVAACVITEFALVGCSLDGDPVQPEFKPYVAVAGPVGDLYRFCFESGEDPADYTFEALMYMDEVNAPNPRFSNPYLRLMNTAEHGNLWESIPFDYYEFEAIPATAGFPDPVTRGWKTRVWGARVDTCDACYTDRGKLWLLSLYGPVDQVEFIWDPEDTVEAYIRPVPLEGNQK